LPGQNKLLCFEYGSFSLHPPRSYNMEPGQVPRLAGRWLRHWVGSVVIDAEFGMEDHSSMLRSYDWKMAQTLHLLPMSLNEQIADILIKSLHRPWTIWYYSNLRRSVNYKEVPK
jgi:hypothetical protein